MHHTPRQIQLVSSP